MEPLQKLTAIEIYNFKSQQLRVVGTFEEPWFAAKDICDILGIVNTHNSLINIPDKWKGVCKINTLKGDQEMSIVNESGLYKMILRSNKSEAQPFQEWVCEEVLPGIRKKGEYVLEEYKHKLEEKTREAEERQKTIEIQQKYLSKVIKKQTEKYDEGCCFYTAINPLIDGWFKGGLTEHSTDRISKLSTASPEKMYYHKLWYIKNFNLSLFEKMVFETFKSYRKSNDNEWFSNDCLEKMCEFVDCQVKILEKYTSNIEKIPEEILKENEKMFEKEREQRELEIKQRKAEKLLERKKIREEKLLQKKAEKKKEKEAAALERKKIREEKMIENAKKIEAELKALEQKKEEAKKALEQKIAEEEKILLEEKTNEEKVWNHSGET